MRLKKKVYKVRFGTLNVGAMTGRSRAIADLMKNRLVNILCVQDTRWTGNKAKEVGDGYKLIYSGASKGRNKVRNGVGIILPKDLKVLVTEVNRKNDRVMWLRLALKDFNINIFSVDTPQSGCPEEEKEKFWNDLQEEIEKVEDHEKCRVNGDLNGHISGGTNVISRIHGGNYFGEGNEEGERVIDFAISNDLVVCNTIFKKRPEHLITNRNGNRASQIHFMLYRRCGRAEILDCKVIPGDHVAAQHRLVTLDLAIMVTQKQIEKRQGLKRIKWFKLKYPEKKTEFKDKVLNELEPRILDVEDWWNRSSGVILRAAREVQSAT